MKTLYKVFRNQQEDNPSIADTILVVCSTIYNKDGHPTVGLIAEEFKPVAKIYSDLIIKEDLKKGNLPGSSDDFNTCEIDELIEYLEITESIPDYKVNDISEQSFQFDGLSYVMKSIALGLLPMQIDGIPELGTLIEIRGSSNPKDIELYEEIVKEMESDDVPEEVFEMGKLILKS